MKECPKCKITYADFENQCRICYANLITRITNKSDAKADKKDSRLYCQVCGEPWLNHKYACKKQIVNNTAPAGG